MPISSGAYSARVRIELRVNGVRLRVAKLGPDCLYLDAPHAFPATTGDVIMYVDGRERRWRVALRPRGEADRVIPAVFEPD